MNTKMLIGFLAGAMAASVGSYFLSHRTRPAPPPVIAIAPAPAPPAPVIAEPPAKEIAPARVTRPAPPIKLARVEKLKTVAAPSVSEGIAEAAPAPAPEPPKPQEPAPVATAPVTVAPPPALTPEPPPALLKPERETRREPPPPPNSVTIQPGALISVRLAEALSSRRNQSGDTFFATLDQPLVIDGFVIAERGARAEGRVSEAEDKGRGKGLPRLSIELTGISTADGQKVPIHTARFEKTGTAAKGEDALKIGTGAVLGTAIGAAAGGGKGAAIGAAAGTAAGIGTVMATRAKPAELAIETRISFRIEERVTITEQAR